MRESSLFLSTRVRVLLVLLGSRVDLVRWSDTLSQPSGDIERLGDRISDDRRGIPHHFVLPPSWV